MNNPFSPKLKTLPKMTSGRIALWQAMTVLGYKKQYHEITVKELCKTAYIARSTFYLTYKNIDELLMDMEDYHLRQLIPIYDVYVRTDYLNRQEHFCSDTIRYIQENRKFFYLFLVQQPNMRFIQKGKILIKYCLWENLKKDDTSGALAPQEELLFEMISGEIVTAHGILLKYTQEETVEDLKKVLNEGLCFFGKMYTLINTGQNAQ
jgi:AcrR family transcriptional regulator